MLCGDTPYRSPSTVLLFYGSEDRRYQGFYDGFGYHRCGVFELHGLCCGNCGTFSICSNLLPMCIRCCDYCTGPLLYLQHRCMHASRPSGGGLQYRGMDFFRILNDHSAMPSFFHSTSGWHKYTRCGDTYTEALNTPFVPICLSELALSGGRYESAKAGYENTSPSHKWWGRY